MPYTDTELIATHSRCIEIGGFEVREQEQKLYVYFMYRENRCLPRVNSLAMTLCHRGLLVHGASLSIDNG